MLEIRLSCKKLLVTRQNKCKMAIVNEGDKKKIVLNYIKTQKLLASLIDGLTPTYVFSQQSMKGGRRSPDVSH